MKNIQTILIAVLTVAVAVLFFLHFKGNGSGPKVNLSGNPSAMAAGDFGKIAFINTDTFFANYTKYKTLEKEIEAQQKGAQSSLQGRMKALETEYMQLVQQAQAGQINPQQAQAKEQALVKRKQALEAESQTIMKSIADKGAKASEELHKTLQDYFDENKGKYNCNYVMGYQKEGIVYYVDPKLDITKQVLEDLNK
jgi:outer membrane protein